MHKLVAALFICMLVMMIQAQQYDEEMALHALFRAKNAVNRAAHAAAQQVDTDRMARGERWIDETLAEQTALLYLRHNLQLDESLTPLPGSFWNARMEVLVFEVINGDQTFPYTYSHAAYDYTVTLEHPGVVLMIRLDYPRTFSMVDPIRWVIKGTAELYLP